MRKWNVQQDQSTTFIGNAITCAMSNKATQLVVDDPKNGSVKSIVYFIEANVWTGVDEFVGVAPTHEFGFSVGIAKDSRRICVGAPGNNYVNIYYFLEDGIFWTLVLDDFKNCFGRALALYRDGIMMDVGVYDTINTVGSAFFYEMEDYYVIQQCDGDITAHSGGYSFGYSITLNTSGNVNTIGRKEEDFVKLLRLNTTVN